MVVPRADHGFPAENGRIRIDNDVVFHGGMPFSAFANSSLFILLETPRAQRDRMIEFHPRPDLAGLANDHASPVIDEEVRPDFCAGMNVDSRPAVRPFGHHPRNQRHVFVI